MDKFSEMSHAERVAYLASKVALAKSYDSPVLTVPIPDLEILLAELEASSLQCRGIEQERELFRLERTAHQLHAQALEQRIAELEAYNVKLREWNAGLAQESCELQAKLATPVRLPRPACNYADHSYPAYSRKQVEEIISSAGLRFTVEGDEQ